MIEKDPSTFTWLAYLWVLALSSLGGIVHYVHKVRTGVSARFNLPELVGDMFASAFVGVITFYICEWAGVDKLLTAAFVGIAGHMGSRALFLAESVIERKIDRWLERLTGKKMGE